MKRPKWNLSALLVLAPVALLAVACGGSSTSSSSGAGTARSVTTDAASLASAKAGLAQFIGAPTPFPATGKAVVKHGLKIAFASCGTPVCTGLQQITGAAAKAAGATLVPVNAGLQAQGINNAFSTIVQMHPDAVIDAGIDPIFWKSQLAQLEAAHIPISTTGIGDADEFHLAAYPNATQSGVPAFVRTGTAMANYIYVQYGNTANIAFDNTPELTFLDAQKDAFFARFKTLCPGCSVRYVKIPVASLGTTAPQLQVSDVQAHPRTNVLVGGDCENQIGLPAALKTAGLSPALVCDDPSPANLQYLKAGQTKMVFGYDQSVLGWTLVDTAVRAASGVPIPATEQNGYPVNEVLTQADISFNPAGGWTPYPDYAQRFEALWSVS